MTNPPHRPAPSAAGAAARPTANTQLPSKENLVSILLGDIAIAVAEIRGPAHHLPAIAEAISNMTAVFEPEIVAAAFGMVEHAISVAWPVRPAAFAPLTFTQFHQLVRDRYYADLYRRALGLGADMDETGSLASDVAVALLTDPQLSP